MGRIEIISASAGSGKTYHLAKTLNQALADGTVRPERVLAVTFTNRAAAELLERVRRFLFRVGRLEDAQRLAAARFGTVNAVCGQLVKDFAFEIGLSPEQTVLDEEAAVLTLRRAVSQVVEPRQAGRLAELETRLKELDWQELAQRIVELARANRIGPEGLEASCRRSIASLRELLDPPRASGEEIEGLLKAALRRFLEHPVGADSTQATEAYRQRAGSVLHLLTRRLPIPWDDWAGLATGRVGRKSQQAVAPVHLAASAFRLHPRFQEDLVGAVEGIFRLALEVGATYQELKLQQGAVDFVDQEVLALQLLKIPNVREQLGAELDLILVDEFQDTSPIQLEIFLRLAEIAPRSVWVGDQKQAIYGFRGTDPALMDSAIESILAGVEPRTLETSWRSRPALVQLTSQLFAPSFARYQIPPSRVRLQPALEKEPAGLGPVVERWRLGARNAAEEAQCLARGIAELLDDPEVRVRDLESGEPRRLGCADLALLCRTNLSCLTAASELSRLGVANIVARQGLLATPEAQLVLAGLKRWIDPQDSLAAAQLARLTHYEVEEEEWLEAALRAPRAEAFRETGSVRCLDRARGEGSQRQLIDTLDTILDAIAVRAKALAWGASQERLANLDALRSHAVRYLASCASQGIAATPLGLVGWLERLGEEGTDAQAVVAGQDAVTVSTWHSAKGLEWPVVILSDLESERQPAALGVHVMQDRKEFDFAAPLCGRWIRYWPNPFLSGRTRTFLHQRLTEHPATEELEERAERERLRLLYVGWTRARDRVVLTSRSRNRLEDVLPLLRDHRRSLVPEPQEGKARWGGEVVPIQVRELEPQEPPAPEPRAGEGYLAPGPVPHPSTFLAPSALQEEGEVLAIERLGDRLQLVGSPETRRLGEALHGFLATDGSELDESYRRELAEGLLQRWGLSESFELEDLLLAGDRLQRWIEERWPGARCHREWPLLRGLADGSLVRGTADLVLELEEGFVLVDHKSFAGASEEATGRAAGHAGQLEAYAATIAVATGKALLGAFIHLPMNGLMVRVAAPSNPSPPGAAVPFRAPAG